MNMIATDNLQSQRLLRCGVSADTADMSYQFIDECVNDTDKPICSTPKEQFDTIRGYGFGVSRIHITPAWSLSALLMKVLPHNISVDKYKYKGVTEYEVGCYFTGHRDKIAFNAPDPIEACVQLIEWLTNNGYKLNEQ